VTTFLAKSSSRLPTPETEWVRGRPLQKVSPTRSHSRLQMELSFALNAWAHGRGEVGTEWRFRIAPEGEPRRPLVPDICFVAFDRLRGHTAEELETPAFAPNVTQVSPKKQAKVSYRCSMRKEALLSSETTFVSSKYALKARCFARDRSNA